MTRLAQLIQGRAALCSALHRCRKTFARPRERPALARPAATYCSRRADARSLQHEGVGVRSVNLRLHPTGSVDRVSAPCCRWPGAVASRQCCHPLSQPLCCCDLSRCVRGGGGSTFRDADSPGPNATLSACSLQARWAQAEAHADVWKATSNVRELSTSRHCARFLSLPGEAA